MNDLISRQEAIDALIDRFAELAYWNPEVVIDTLKKVPSAQPKKGKWIAHPGGKFVGFPYMHYECDQCRDFEPEERNFCPNCGADMRGGENVTLN